MTRKKKTHLDEAPESCLSHFRQIQVCGSLFLAFCPVESLLGLYLIWLLFEALKGLTGSFRMVCVAQRSFGVRWGSVACCAPPARATGHPLECLLAPPLSCPLSPLYLGFHSLFDG